MFGNLHNLMLSQCILSAILAGMIFFSYSCLMHFKDMSISFYFSKTFFHFVYMFLLFVLFTAIVKFRSEQFNLHEYANIEDVNIDN